MSGTAKLTASVRYTAPGDVSVSSPFVAETPVCAASNLGSADMASGATAGQAISIPFGSVGSPTAFVIENNLTGDITVALPSFRLAPGGVLMIAQPVASGAVPLASATCTTTATQSGTGSVDYMVFGDAG